MAGAVLVGLFTGVSVNGVRAAQPAAHVPVVIVAVPDLRWSDLEFMPQLSAYAAQSSVAELSVKGLPGAARCPDGELTFSAGSRVGTKGLRPCTLPASVLAEQRAAALHSSFEAHVGAFGDALRRAGLRTVAADSAAVAILADSSGRVDTVQHGSLAAAVHEGAVTAVVDEGMYGIVGAERDQDAAAYDPALHRQLASLPSNAVVFVVGISDGALTQAHLHVLLVHGPGWAHRALRSASTAAPYVQLIDLAPTILTLLHVPVPEPMVGSPAHLTSVAAASASHYADDDHHASAARGVNRRVRDTLGELGLATIALLALGAWRREAAVGAMWLARVAVAAPLCTFLAQLLPWWRWGTWAFAGIVAAFCLLFAAAITFVSRWGERVALLLVPATTTLILIIDQLTGARLQLSAPLGDNPTIAGRFHGVGNIDFALLCASALITAAVLAGWLRASGRRGAAVAVAAVICAVAMGVDAAPSLGDDFGGLLTMVPVVAVLLALVLGIRVTWRRVFLVVVAAAVLAVGIALLDYARPVAHQTHVGRFVGQVLHGGASVVVRRKLHASLSSFGNVAVTGFVVVLLAGVLAARKPVAKALRAVPGLSAGCVVVGLLALLGTFLNDSGVVIALVALLVTFLAPVAAGLGLLPESATPGQGMSLGECEANED